MHIRRFGAVALLLSLIVLVNSRTAAATLKSKASSHADQISTVPPELAWPVLTDEQQAQAVDKLKAISEQTQTKLGRPCQLYETKYFLFYSDLSAREANNWSGLLDRMYARLCETFGVPKGKNIWLGKALVFVFSKEADYMRFEADVAKTDAKGTAGMCHSYGDGKVIIAFYRQPQELEFAHVLVHESVHGFVHRYRSRVFVPSWANEGLAEVIATDLVPQRGRRDMMRTLAREGLQKHDNSMGDFFTAQHIAGWQYPVAQMLCEFMITAGKKNYVDFINGIKDGMNWDDALSTKFQAPVERLVAVFGQTLGIKNLSE
jgi:hypothetical protein